MSPAIREWQLMCAYSCEYFLGVPCPTPPGSPPVSVPVPTDTPSVPPVATMPVPPDTPFVPTRYSPTFSPTVPPQRGMVDFTLADLYWPPTIY